VIHSFPLIGEKRPPLWLEVPILAAVALLMAIVMKALFVQAFYIPSGSMEPGLQVDDRILVQKVSYWFTGPQRGDVVVFKDPGGWLYESEAQEPGLLGKGMAKVGLYPTGGHLVKRVIAVAGDVVTTDDEGRIEVNSATLDEDSYLNEPNAGCDAPNIDCRQHIVGPIPKGYVFVMGDNRGNSLDSTAHLCAPADKNCPPTTGLVPVDDIVGRAFILVWPANHFRWLTKPSTFATIP
jgi:signal peptidase I